PKRVGLLAVAGGEVGFDVLVPDRGHGCSLSVEVSGAGCGFPRGLQLRSVLPAPVSTRPPPSGAENNGAGSLGRPRRTAGVGRPGRGGAAGPGASLRAPLGAP